jgi:transposase
MKERVNLEGIFFMAKQGQVSQQYTEALKLAAVKAYVEGSESYQAVAEKLAIRNCTQLKVWVKKWRNEEAFDVRKGLSSPLKGRPRTAFASVEEERDYLKAQVDYLKKWYPNLLKETASVSKTAIK